MKRKCIFILLLLVLSIEKVTASTNPYNKELSWGGTNCAWAAWQNVYEKTGIALVGFNGNAVNWYSEAQKYGYAVGSEPKAKSVIVLDNYLNYGHVAYVESVSGNSVYVWDSVPCYREMTEEEKNNYYECLITKTTNEQDSYLCDYLLIKEETTCEYSVENGNLTNVVGYIYVTEPRTYTSSSSSSTNNATNKKELSNNNNLSSLTITNIDFTFAKDTLEYNLEVANNIESIQIMAEAEDSTSTVLGTGLINLNIGSNEIDIVVTAESGDVKTYKLNVNRLESGNNESKQTLIDLDRHSLNNWYLSLIYVILVVIILVIILIRKKAKKK